MPYKVKRRVYRRKRQASRVTKKGVRKVVRRYKEKVFNNRVKQAMASLMEVKHVEENGAFNPLVFDGATNQATIDATNQIIFDPQIDLGTAVDERIGNRLMMKSVKMSYSLCTNSYTVSGVAAPCQVRMVFYYDRTNPRNLPTPYTDADFFDFNNTNQAFAGTISDMVRRFNSNKYRILKVKTFKLGHASYGGTGTSSANQAFTNNDYRLNYRGTIDLTKSIIKRQIFDDATNLSMSRKLYCLVYVTTVNTALFSSTNLPVNMQYQIQYKYTDA